jgi:uncharacterized 2Fe-2S/4Fe-4S cluster protein (DUF4445 family)
MPKRFTVLFEPNGRRCAATAGQTVLEVAQANGIDLNAPCGGKGVCGGCRVQILDDAREPSAQCRRVLSSEELGRGLRLACQHRVTADMTVVIPPESRRGEQQILENGMAAEIEPAPAIRKVFLPLPAPTVADQRADCDRLTDALGERDIQATVSLEVCRRLPALLRKADFQATAALAGGRVIAVEPGDTTDALLGIAFDVGTTTVVGRLMDLATGNSLAVASRTNPQTAYGDDVVSRIELTTTRPDGLGILQKSIVGCLEQITEQLLSLAGGERSAVCELVAVGNTTMTHLLLGLPPASLAQAPYLGVQRASAWTAAAEVGLRIAPGGRLFVAPNIAGFVGSDTVAMILATRMHAPDGVRLAVDIGTNGEMVLATPDGLYACSTAAGPAFEGARITYGMRATDGAIDRVDIDEEGIHCRTINGAAPVGLCGTGLLDAVAELVRIGVIDETGAIETDAAGRAGMPWLAAYLGADEHGSYVVLSNDRENGGKTVLLTQRDVRQVQLAKAAIRAGITILLAEAGVELAQVERVFLAGAFGNYIRRSRALAVGLLPPVDEQRIVFVGNAAGTGASHLLVSRPLRDLAERISRQSRYVELAGRPDFQDIFTEMLMFPAPAGRRGHR